jgi:molybdate transport repressor ModE-like protein
VVFGKRLKLGSGRAHLLRSIDARGSLRQAAAEFRNAWGYLQELERAAGFKFVERAPGGGPRSGMRLTAAGREFLACYEKFSRGLEEAARRHFERSFKGKEFRSRTRPPERSARARAAAR